MRRQILIMCVILLTVCGLLAVRYYKPRVDGSSCVGCGDCIKSCPVQAIEFKDGKAEISDSLCIDCKQCVKACPYNSIRTGK